jgi:hypothetical protein
MSSENNFFLMTLYSLKRPASLILWSLAEPRKMARLLGLGTLAQKGIVFPEEKK